MSWTAEREAAKKVLSGDFKFLRREKFGEMSDVEFQKWLARIEQSELTDDERKSLDDCRVLEKTFYTDLVDYMNPAVDEERQKVWALVRSIILPKISYYEPTPKGALNPTAAQWFMITKATGSGKTFTATYLVFWALRWYKWVERVYGVTPLYAGEPAWYPYPLRNDDGSRMIHPKYRELKILRELGNIRNAIFFGDEIGSLLPARGFTDRRQWVLLKMAKDFRRHNVMPVMTEQYPKNLDLLLRENISVIIEPSLDVPGGDFEFRVFPNQDADLTIYYNYTKLGMGNPPQVYPRWDRPNNEFYHPVLPWFVGFFDSTHEVELMFQQPLDEKSIDKETEDFRRWLSETNHMGLWLNYYAMDMQPPLVDIKNALVNWNIVCEKQYVGEELRLIFAEYRKRYYAPETKGKEEVLIVDTYTSAFIKKQEKIIRTSNKSKPAKMEILVEYLEYFDDVDALATFIGYPAYGESQ